MKTEQTKQKENPVELYETPAIEVIDVELGQNILGSAPDFPGEGA